MVKHASIIVKKIVTVVECSSRGTIYTSVERTLLRKWGWEITPG